MDAFLTGQLRRINKLLEQQKHSNARQITEELIQRYPDEPLLHAARIRAHTGGRARKRANQLLQEALARFPDHDKILFLKGEFLAEKNKFDEAESAYRRSLEMTSRELKRDRSNCCIALGKVIWQQDRKAEALATWGMAVTEDHTNPEAAKLLAESTNEYGEPRSPGPFNDIYHFQNIHLHRYHTARGRNRLESEKEAKQVLGAIMQAWNEKIAPQAKSLDGMTAAEKTALFESVTVDFAKPFEPPLTSPREPAKVLRLAGPSIKPATKKREEEFFNLLDNVFGFLPGQLPKLIWLALPAMEAAGLKRKRFFKIVEGAPITDKEKEIVKWAGEVFESVQSAKFSRNTDDEVDAMCDALTVACTVLPAAEASFVIGELRATLDELEKDALAEEQEHKKGTRTPKR